jgi:hypothetical protein
MKDFDEYIDNIEEAIDQYKSGNIGQIDLVSILQGVVNLMREDAF